MITGHIVQPCKPRLFQYITGKYGSERITAKHNPVVVHSVIYTIWICDRTTMADKTSLKTQIHASTA